MADFALALGIVLEEEGNGEPSGDPGGQTKWGVARAAHPEITDAQWANWTRPDSEALLRSQYWEPHRLGEAPWAWALGVFDGEVNQGSVISAAQLALGVVGDGVIGDQTLAAMARAGDAQFTRFIALRAQMYIADAQFGQFGNGWLARLANVTLRAGRGS